MIERVMMPIMITAMLVSVISMLPGCGAEQRTFTIQEPFGLNWGPDRVSYAVEFPRGAVRRQGWS